MYFLNFLIFLKFILKNIMFYFRIDFIILFQKKFILYIFNLCKFLFLLFLYF